MVQPKFFTVQFIDTTGQLIYRDLRYPLIREDDVNSSIFSYELVRKGDRWDIKPLFDGAISKDDLNQFIKEFWSLDFSFGLGQNSNF